jgi:hypothetical protein
MFPSAWVLGKRVPRPRLAVGAVSADQAAPQDLCHAGKIAHTDARDHQRLAEPAGKGRDHDIKERRGPVPRNASCSPVGGSHNGTGNSSHWLLNECERRTWSARLVCLRQENRACHSSSYSL